MFGSKECRAMVTGEQFQPLHSGCDFHENRLNFKFIFIVYRTFSIPCVLSLKENSLHSQGGKIFCSKAKVLIKLPRLGSPVRDRKLGLSFFLRNQMSFRCFTITKVYVIEPHTNLFLTVCRCR